jgi:putative secretion ATPase (PEP-CTERM system associated)
MYERFYNLRERPFALSPDPEYLYLSRVHREALDSVRYGIESRAGFIVVTGEIGAGKTTLLQTLLQRLDDRTVVARIVNTMLEPRELLEAIVLDFGLDTTASSKPALLRDLGLFLVQQRAQGRRPLLVIDEAQNLSAQALEEVRLLSNLETEKSKLLQILLAGQPNLRDKIASPELEQFRQRIAVGYHLTALDAPETAAYINFRLEHAAIGEPPRFSAEASDLVHQVSGGVPRIINVICDATLVFGYAEERRSIDRNLIEEVIGELETTGVIPRQESRQKAARDVVPTVTVAAAAHAEPVFAVVSPRPAAFEGDLARHRSLAAARETVLQARQLAAAREAELAAQRELVNQRQAELVAREQLMLQREHQIAEQRRVMGEEYRLLRQAQPGRDSVPASAATRGSGRPDPLYAPPPRHRAARAVPFWQRIFRILTGEHALRF